MKQSGIYKILNKISEKIYVGSAYNMHIRWQQHQSLLRLNKHHSKYLQASWNLHGEEAFEFIVLEIVDKQNLIEREQYWIDETKCCNSHIGYNVRLKAESNLGLTPSKNHREKISKALTGLIRSDETKAKMSTWQIGRKMSEEAIAKMATSTRKFDKWPHADGAFCKCQECIDKRTASHRIWKTEEKIKKGRIIASSYIQGMML